MVGKRLKSLKGGYFWYISAFLLVFVILAFIVESYLFGKSPDEQDWHSVVVAVRNFMLLGIVGVSAWRFGFMGGLVASLAVGLIVLPHVIIETIIGGYHPEILTEYAVVIPMGVVISVLVGALRRTENNLKDSEKRYRRLFETAQDAILILDGDSGKIIDANPFVKDLLGYSMEELVGKHLWEIGELKDIPASKISYQELSEGGYKRWDDMPLVSKDGRQISVEVVANAYQVDHTRIIQCNIRDMTVANLAMESLRVLYDDLKVAQRLTKIGNWKWIISSNKITWSDELCRINGWDPEVPVPPFAEMERFYTPDGWNRLSEAVAKAFNTGESYELELTQIRTDCTEITTFSRGEADFDANGKITGLHGTVQDITERKQMEIVMSRLQLAVDASGEAIFMTNPDGIITYINPEFTRLYGYSPEEVVNLATPRIIKSGRMKEENYQQFWRTILAKQIVHGEIVNQTKDGSLITVEGSASPILNVQGDIIGFLAIQSDITERKKAEETLKLQAELLDAELDSVYLHDFEGNLIYVNRAAYLTHGYTREELLSMKLSQLDDPESARLIAPRMKEISEKGQSTFEVNHRHKNGHLIPLEVHTSLMELGSKKLIMSVAHDITERNKLQVQLMSQDRLASIGQLVSGVAHEINNPLTGVIGFSELLLRRDDLPDDVKEDLEIVNSEATRTSVIVKNLLAFARKQPEGKAPVDINEQVQGVLSLREHEQKVNNIQVITRFASDLPAVMGNASQLQQVFFNIVINAEFFMLEAHRKGTLTITTERVGKTVRVSIADDGPGIKPEYMNRLFTPFFTTKDVGKGTGLGLSICHGIVTEHGGRIYAESELGKGATFIVELPFKEETPG